ncbi:hypothetical protein AYO44_01705 [Planctomycetaceae bacterium SCGC AG-212-F19]|nr:hypothetical protein AYO44_01705 [Planctomycetaceae bacterium SCGC AG-212-F19]
MEPLEPAVKRARKWCPGALALVLAFASGCVALDEFVHKADVPPVGAVYQVVAAWNKEVMFAPDPVNGGRPTPGLTGRLYLFGPQIDFPLEGDGSLVVELYTVPTPAPQGSAAPPAESKRLERWELDKETLHRLLRKDPIGWGYTLFLPWSTYRPDLTQVKLRICYQPQHGTPLYADSPLSLSRARMN